MKSDVKAKGNRLNILSYFKKYLFLYILATLAMLAGTFLDMVAPKIVQHIVDDVLVARNIEPLKLLLLGFLGIGVGRFVFQYAKEFICDWCGSKIASEIRINLFQKIQSLSANFFDGINSGELMSRVKDDVDSIWNIAAFMAILMAEVMVRVVCTLYFMGTINWQLSLIPIAGMIAAAVIAVIMENKLGGHFEKVAQENSELNNVAQENLAGVRTVKAFAREQHEIFKFHQHNQKYYELNIDLSRVFVKYNPIIQVITRMLTVVSLLLGGLIVMKGNPLQGGKTMTIGELMAFLQYVGNIVWPMEMMGWLTNGFAQAQASVERLNKIYEQEAQIKEQSGISLDDDDATLTEKLFNSFDITGQVSFENVYYKSGEKDVLKDVSFEIGAGKTLGIMGSTGSGKTTIINLLKRMYDVTDGSIKIDGVDIREIPLAALRRSVACVMQDIFLFSDTIDGNVRLGARESLGAAEVRVALENSHSAEFVDKMEDGEMTVIGERGVGLSGGQKQRITIARALARKTPILVLDDSTSALDTETEHEIQEVLNDLTGMTKIIIAHRISAVKKADMIIVLDKGSVAECGTHQELLEKKGLYWETYQSQYS